MKRKYLLLVEAYFQPNILEKLVGFLRRRNYEYRRLTFTRIGDEHAIIIFEVSCNSYELEQLIKNYQGFPEVIKVEFCKALDDARELELSEEVMRLSKNIL
ncbi:MAG: hypothetical protein DRN49_05485 [Thaumarchaeota archaeon]|nr:MAG: hypothetical protein DRN49_05485 [Nitrososphaerota archaeon]